MEEKENTGIGQEPNHQPPAKRYIKLQPFSFVMLVFGLVLATAGVTFFALTTGEDKVVVARVDQLLPALVRERNQFGGGNQRISTEPPRHRSGMGVVANTLGEWIANVSAYRRCDANWPPQIFQQRRLLDM